jgi:hypothetical protein
MAQAPSSTWFVACLHIKILLLQLQHDCLNEHVGRLQSKLSCPDNLLI